MKRLVGFEGGGIVTLVEGSIDLRLQRLEFAHGLPWEAFCSKARCQSLENQSNRCHLVECGQCQGWNDDGLWSAIDQRSLANEPHDRISGRRGADTQSLSDCPHRELL